MERPASAVCVRAGHERRIDRLIQRGGRKDRMVIGRRHINAQQSRAGIDAQQTQRIAHAIRRIRARASALPIWAKGVRSGAAITTSLSTFMVCLRYGIP